MFYYDDVPRNKLYSLFLGTWYKEKEKKNTLLLLKHLVP